MTQHLAILTLCACLPAFINAQCADNDTVAADSIQLAEVVVEGRLQRLGTEKSTYIPTEAQKNSSQSATDLLNRMDLPQLRIAADNAVTDLAGRNVDIFIDYLPASPQDLRGMKIADVKRVEYYDFPSDPRFQGSRHVVNFIMQQYVFGGYVKPYLERCFIAGTAQWALFTRLQYKRMTFDIAGDGFYGDKTHDGSDRWETYHLPQTDGSVNTIEKQSSTTASRMIRRDHYVYFRAKYSADRFTMRSSLMLTLADRPTNDESGSVTYSRAAFPASNFSSSSATRANTLSYDANIFYKFDDSNSLSFRPSYSFSHTNTSSLYSEGDGPQFYNSALDDTHEIMTPLTYSHAFGESSKLRLYFNSYFSKSLTRYTGTAESVDRSDQLTINSGANYSLKRGRFYCYVGAGMIWNRMRYTSTKQIAVAPWADFSLQYSPNDRHNASLEYHHMSSAPSPNYLSPNIIRRDPLMSITGNPNLKPYHCNDLSISYNFAPNNSYSFSAFTYLMTVGNRHVLDYTASPEGILRKVIQPGGSYWGLDYGIHASARLLKSKLQLSASVYGATWHNGAPYNQDKTKFFYYLQAFYYLGKWNFGAMYYARHTHPDGFSNSIVVTTSPTYYLLVGWSDAKWNIRCTVYDFAKWGWKSDRSEMLSPDYDVVTQAYAQADHCFVKLSATYTFSFGRKVERGDDSIQRSEASSGILR